LVFGRRRCEFNDLFGGRRGVDQREQVVKQLRIRSSTWLELSASDSARAASRPAKGASTSSASPHFSKGIGASGPWI
jgi:hypothetical protein